MEQKQNVCKDEIVKKLLSLKKIESEEYFIRHKNIINSKQKIICVASRDIRAVAKEVSKNDYFDYLNQAKNTHASEEYYEETLVQGIVIANQKNLDEQISNFSWWVNKIDNWSTCDSTICSMKVLKKSKNKDKYFEFFENLCYSNEEFVSRFGIISLMSNYLTEEHIDELLHVAKSVKNEAYYVQMAIAWMLSFCFMKFRDKTFELIKEKSLPKFVQNKTISKCRDSYIVSDSDKELLTQYRIK